MRQQTNGKVAPISRLIVSAGSRLGVTGVTFPLAAASAEEVGSQIENLTEAFDDCKTPFSCHVDFSQSNQFLVCRLQSDSIQIDTSADGVSEACFTALGGIQNLYPCYAPPWVLLHSSLL